MTKEEAKAFLYSIAGDLGFRDVENYTCKDGEKMREAIMTLEEETPCCKEAVSRQVVKEQMIKHGFHAPDMTVTEFVEDLPSVTQQQKYEDIAKAFQFGMALGFGERHDEMDKVIDEIKKVITPQPKTDVLDKIRAEIEECKQYRGMTGNSVIDKHNVGLDKYFDLGLEKAIKIIDNYKVEREDKG